MKRIIVVLLSIMMFIGAFITPSRINAEGINTTISTEENTEQQTTRSNTKEYETMDVEIYFYSSGREWTYSFPYSDDWFRESDDHYNHQLCQGSFGLTVAAFRVMNLDLGYQDISLIKYYQDTGFTNIETYNYENQPTDDSISNGIASKVIDDFTLLAVGVCGSGYRNEWCSNLTMGEQLRHVGFNSAAKQVENRIVDYIEKYNITGKIKVWLTGFSRASAVSNLVAADLTDSGKFEDVYGYHFAVPNNTTESKEYNNLYCICGKNDPVTFVALKEWGYGKYGTALYTPSRETDSSFNTKHMRASAVYQDLTGEALSVSPAINKSIRLILLNLLDMVPARSDYVSSLQDNVITAWHAKSNTSDLIMFLAGVLEELGNSNGDIKEKTSQLGEYILNLGVEFTTKNPNSVFTSDLYESFNIAANLVREHQPMTYMAWLFSDDNPDRIFTENLDFTRLFIHGDVTITIYDDKGLLETIEDGLIKRSLPKNSAVSLSSSTNFLYSKQDNDKIELIIPKDKNYLIQIQCADGSFIYEGASFTGRSIQGKQIDRVTVNTEDKTSYYILSRAKSNQEVKFAYDENCELIESSNYASPTVLLAMENSNIFHLTFEQMKNYGKINIALVTLFVLFILIRVTRVKVLKKKASRLVTFCLNLSISFIFILLYEQANIYLDSVPVVRTVLGILTMFSVLHLSYTTMKPINRRLSKFFLLAIILVACGNGAKQYLGVDISTLLYIGGCIVITIGIVSERKPGRKLIHLWGIISIAASILASWLINDIVVLFIVYIFAIVAMNIAAEHIDRRLRLLIATFMLPSCLSVWESYTGGNVKMHTFLVLAYSILLLIMIGIILYKSYRIEKTYESKKAVN